MSVSVIEAEQRLFYTSQLFRQTIHARDSFYVFLRVFPWRPLPSFSFNLGMIIVNFVIVLVNVLHGSFIHYIFTRARLSVIKIELLWWRVSRSIIDIDILLEPFNVEPVFYLLPYDYLFKDDIWAIVFRGFHVRGSVSYQKCTKSYLFFSC